MGASWRAGPHQSVARNWGKNITLISSISKEQGMGASHVVEGSTNGAVFESYLEDVVCPTLKRGQMVVMDNLSAHKAEKVTELMEAEGWELLSTCRPSIGRLQSHRGGLLQA
jgi:DDE superfamily endonuclease